MQQPKNGHKGLKSAKSKKVKKKMEDFIVSVLLSALIELGSEEGSCRAGGLDRAVYAMIVLSSGILTSYNNNKGAQELDQQWINSG